MLVGPIFSSELIAGARRTRYYLWRVLYAGLLLAVLVVVYLLSFGLKGADSISDASNYARSFFLSYAVLQLVAVFVLGPALAAGSIARERERRTLEYLFTTHLTSAEIVLNKLTAAVVQIAAAAMVGVPVLAIAMFLGGIAPDELLAVTLITLSTIAAVVALSLINSVLARRARDAVARTYLMLFALTLGPMILQLLMRGLGVWPLIDAAFEAMSSIQPLSVLFAVVSGPESSGAYARPPVDRWSLVRWMMICHGILTVFAIAFCSWVLRRVSLEAAVGTTADQRRGRRWRPQMGEHPLLWKEAFAGRSYSRAARWGRGLQWLVVLGAVLGSAWQYTDAMLAGNAHGFLVFAQWFGVLLECGALLLVAAWASNSIAAERERETWTMLVSTPLSCQEIVAGKVAGSLYAACVLLAPLVVLWMFAAVADPRFMPSIPFTLATLLVLGVSSALVGLLFSLWCANGTRALAATLGTGLAVVTLGTCCWFPLGMLNPIFLLGIPGVACTMAMDASMDRTTLYVFGGMMGMVWVVGMGLQVGLICTVWAVFVSFFDKWAGRFHFSGPYWTAPGAPVVAQYVSEGAAAASPFRKTEPTTTQLEAAAISAEPPATGRGPG